MPSRHSAARSRPDGTLALRLPAIARSLLLSLALLAGCAADPNRMLSRAPASASLATGPQAPGYIIVGMARNDDFEEDLISRMQAYRLHFNRIGGGYGEAGHAGCSAAGEPVSLVLSCSHVMARTVVQAQPGIWRLEAFSENRRIANVYISLTIPVRSELSFEAKPGQVVYIGDFTTRMTGRPVRGGLGAYARNDQGAAEALARYPGLGTAFTYIQPGRITTGGKPNAAPAAPPRDTAPDDAAAVE